jgi:hypothetical protein
MSTTRRRLSLAAAIAVVPLAAACGKATGPRPTLDVAISLLPPVVKTTVIEEGVTKIDCSANITAVATGAGEATWTGGAVYYFRGTDQSKIFDSSAVSAAQLADVWGSATITGGIRDTAVYHLKGKESFGGLGEFRYRQSGGRTPRATRVPVQCAG